MDICVTEVRAQTKILFFNARKSFPFGIKTSRTNTEHPHLSMWLSSTIWLQHFASDPLDQSQLQIPHWICFSCYQKHTFPMGFLWLFECCPGVFLCWSLKVMTLYFTIFQGNSVYFARLHNVQNKMFYNVMGIMKTKYCANQQLPHPPIGYCSILYCNAY